MNGSPAPCALTPHSVLGALLRTAAAVEEGMERSLEPLGLSLAKMGALHHLAASAEPLSLGQLAARLSCVRSNVTQLMDRLEADGLVRRARDPADGRTVLAVITEEGRQRFTAASDAQARAEQELLAALGDGDRAALAALLERVAPCPPHPR
jgi:CRISPR type IV-associated protein Csf3